jgi:hypothetical protein
MSQAHIFQLQLVLGYVAWLLLFSVYILPRLKAMPRIEAHRAIATIHSFRWIGLIFILPGVVGPNVPVTFATYGAYGDLATGLLAILALLTIRIRPLFWFFVVAFNIVGVVDFLSDYYLALSSGVPEHAGQLAATYYYVVVLYVPIAMITHLLAFYWLVRPQSQAASSLTINTAAG